MGLFKKFFKGVKKIFKGVGKAFKKVAKSKLGKIVLAAAAIYIGGAMLGAWGGPSWLPTLGKAAAPEVASTAQAATAAGEAAGAGMESALSGEALSGIGAAEADAAITSSGLEAAATDSALNAGIADVAAQEAAAASANGGLLTQVGSGVAEKGVLGKVGSVAKEGFTWMGDNPIPTLMMGNMVQGFMQPDPYKEFVKQQEWERNNANIAGVYGDGRTGQINLPGAGLITQAGLGTYKPMG